MRTIPSPVMSNFGLVRDIGARVTFRDIRLRFNENTNYEDNDGISVTAQPVAYDSADYGSGVLQIVALDESGTVNIWYRYITSAQLDSASWPAWTQYATTIAGRPALYGSRLFFKRASDGQWRYCDFGGVSFGAETSFYDTTGDLAAPVSSTEVYIATHTSGASVNRTEIRMATIGGGVEIWGGRVYNPASWLRFDAVRLGDLDYVFFSDINENRTMYLIREGNTWSDVRPVVPIDIVDDNSKFTLHGATVINNRIMLTGTLVREATSLGGSLPSLVYMFGPGFSLGRDMYIGETGAVDRVVTIATNDYNAIACGNLHVLGNKIWCLGHLIAYEAPATYLIGVDNSAKKLTTSDIGRLSFGAASGNPAQLSFDLSNSVYDPNITRPGADVTLEISYGGQWATIGTFNIDGVPRDQSGEGDVYSVVARGQAMKRMRQWESDASYDYWSQTKDVSNPYDLSRVIVSGGEWKNMLWSFPGDPTHPLMIKGLLNDPGYLQMTAKACRGGMAVGRFYRWFSTEVDVRRGVVMNYHRALQDGASGLTDGDFVNNGLAVIYGDTEHSGADGFAIYKIVEDTWTKLTSFTYTIPVALQKWHWIGMSFLEGVIHVWYRVDDVTDWTLIGTYTYNDADDMPWKNDQEGRVAAFMENVTGYSACPPFSSDTTKVPVADQTIFDAGPADVMCEYEWIKYTGKSPNVAGAPQSLTVTTGTAHPGAPHANAGWTDPGNGYEVWCNTVGANVSRSTYNDMVLVVESGSGVGSVFTVQDYDYSAPQQWVDTGGPYVYPAKWQDYIGNLSYGYWDTANRRRFFVQENTSGILGSDSVVSVYPALTGCTRGYAANNSGYPRYSGPVAHDAGVVSRWGGSRSAVDRLGFFSNDKDWPLEEVIGEIAHKAGVLDYTPNKFYEGSINFSQVGWDVTNLDTYPRQRKSMVVKFKRTSGNEVGFGYGFTDTPHNYGRAVTVDDFNAEIRWYTWASGSPVLVQAFPYSNKAADTPTGNVTISVLNNQAVSVWFGQELMAMFWDESPPAGDNCGFMANGNALIDVDWPDMDRRVDNYILDMGFDAVGLTSQLIGEKRVFFQDGQNGDLRAFSERTIVNTSGAPYELATYAGRTDSDLDIYTRIRVEGAEWAEEASSSQLQLHGNLFHLVNARELDTVDESQDEAYFLINEYLKRAMRTPIVGAFDPRVEPNDQLWIKLPEDAAPANPRTYKYIIEDMQVNIHIDGESATMDMTLNTYRNPDNIYV